MRIYYEDEESDEIETKVFDNVMNLEQLNRELDEQYEYWSEDKGDIVAVTIDNLYRDLDIVTKKLANLTFEDVTDDLGIRDRLLNEQCLIAGQLQNLELNEENGKISALEYMTAKNELVLRVTGEILIPEGQLGDVEFDTDFCPDRELDGQNCPYCNIYAKVDSPNCGDCPMNVANNECGMFYSTYDICYRLWEKKATEEDRQELYDLGVKYLESNIDQTQ